jgi:RNA polymerase sigma factor (sigma-70 family)
MSSARKPSELDRGVAPSDVGRLGPEPLAAEDRYIRRLLRRFISDPHLVDDLAQDTWLAALRNGGATRFLARAWLGRVAQNHAFQALRGRARRIARETEVARALALSPETLEPAHELALGAELRARVLAALEALDEPYRTVLELRFFEDLGPTEIATRLGLPTETVRTRTKRALQQLKLGLQKRR